MNKFKEFLINIFSPEQPTEQPQPQSNYYDPYRYQNLFVFDGEQTPFELGNPIPFEMDYYALRHRAWKSFIKTDVVQNAIKKYCLWVAGSGLKLQADPVKKILENSGITLTDDYIKEFYALPMPVYDGIGNHDFCEGNENTIIELLNASHKNLPAIVQIDQNGHYAWTWDDVLLIQLNLKPSNVIRYKENPKDALTFLQKVLSESATFTTPIIIFSQLVIQNS